MKQIIIRIFTVLIAVATVLTAYLPSFAQSLTLDFDAADFYSGLIEGEYEKDGLFFFADSREDALCRAEELFAELSGFENGVAVITATKQTAALFKSGYSTFELYPNDICHADTIEAPSDPQWSKQYFHTNIDTLGAWELTRGDSAVKVAVLDTGVDTTHPDLINNVTAYESLMSSNDTTDCEGHGTHICGIIAAEADNRLGGCGVAPDATLISIRVFADSEGAYTSDIVAGINLAISLDVDVINMSLGGYSKNSAFQTAINNAAASGITVIAAAGNEETSDFSYPASYNNVISVGALTKNNRRAYFSNYGRKIDISAPGCDILSTAPNGKYAQQSGTSMAAPIVSGVAALMYAVYPDITPDEILKCLCKTATPFTMTDMGKGAVNAAAAVKAVYNLRVPSPSFSVDNAASITDETPIALTDTKAADIFYAVDGGGYTAYTEPFTVIAGEHIISAKAVCEELESFSSTVTVTVLDEDNFDWVEYDAGEKFVATEDFSSGRGFIITDKNSENCLCVTGDMSKEISVKAFYNEEYSIDGFCESCVWHTDANGKLFCISDGITYYLTYYIFNGTYTLAITEDAASSARWKTIPNGDTAVIYASDGVNAKYLYLNYDDGFVLTTSALSSNDCECRAYTCILSQSTGFVALGGTTEYTLAEGISLSEKAILNGLLISFRKNAASAVESVSITDERIKKDWDKPLVTDFPDNYTLTLTYCDKAFGTVAVAVNKCQHIYDNCPDGEQTSFICRVCHNDIVFSGYGTAEKPFEVQNEENLNAVSHLTRFGFDFENTYIKLTANIELSGDFTPMTAFSGNIDGDFRHISSLASPLCYYAEDASFVNLGIVYPDIYSTNDAAAIAVSSKNTLFKSCFVIGGKIASYESAGGIVAKAYGCRIYNCLCTAESGSGTQGDIVAFADTNTIIENCRCNGEIIGDGTATVTHCFSKERFSPCGSVIYDKCGVFDENGRVADTDKTLLSELNGNAEKYGCMWYFSTELLASLRPVLYDVNGDGTVNTVDARTVLACSLGKKSLTSQLYAAASVSGNTPSTADARNALLISVLG